HRAAGVKAYIQGHRPMSYASRRVLCRAQVRTPSKAVPPGAHEHGTPPQGSCAAWRGTGLSMFQLVPWRRHQQDTLTPNLEGPPEYFGRYRMPRQQGPPTEPVILEIFRSAAVRCAVNGSQHSGVYPSS